MYYHVYYLDIFRHVCKWHLIKYIHWHIVLHLRQTTKPLNRTFIKYTACCKSLGVKPVRYRSSTLTHEHLTNISLQHGALGALSISARAKKKTGPRGERTCCYIFLACCIHRWDLLRSRHQGSDPQPGRAALHWSAGIWCGPWFSNFCVMSAATGT